MPIAGVVIIADKQKTMNVLNQLNTIENVTTYGVHKDNHIIAVFEGDTPSELEKMNDDIMNKIDGIYGIYPAYVNFEDEIERENEK
ncbi:MAG: chaperone NapD [Calditrichia bacterium]|nr:chaperone NapD [Calditrichia bacterium]